MLQNEFHDFSQDYTYDLIQSIAGYAITSGYIPQNANLGISDSFFDLYSLDSFVFDTTLYPINSVCFFFENIRNSKMPWNPEEFANVKSIAHLQIDNIAKLTYKKHTIMISKTMLMRYLKWHEQFHKALFMNWYEENCTYPNFKALILGYIA